MIIATTTIKILMILRYVDEIVVKINKLRIVLILQREAIQAMTNSQSDKSCLPYC